MSQSLLKKSINEFEEKKCAALELIDKVIKARKAFDRDFPSGMPTGHERLSLSKLESIKEKITGSKLRLLVAGQFNSGKSTLLNAILGAEVLPEDVAPCTAVITEIEYGSRASATLYFKEGLDLEKLSSSLNEVILDHLKKNFPIVPPLELDLRDKHILGEFLTIPFGTEQIEGVRESPYASCLLKWPLDLCRDGAMLIDSPGLNEHESRDATTLAYLEEADMILHVLNANQPCGMPDRKFIEEVKIRGNSSFPIIFAFNRFDQLRNDKDRDKIKKYAWGLKDLEGTYGRDGIFFISALHALEARLNNDPQGVQNSGLEELERKIASIFVQDRMRLKLAHFYELSDDLEEFNKSLDCLEELLKKDASGLEKAWNKNIREFEHLENEILRIRKKVERVTDRYEKEFRIGLMDFFNAFCEETLPKVVLNAELDEIGVWNTNSASKKAVEDLNQLVNTALGEELKSWIYNEGSELEKSCLMEIRDDIQDNLQEFAETLDNVRDNLNPGELKNTGNASIDILDFMPDALAGAGVGGAVGYAAVFIASRFLPIIAGPAGWVFVALTSALMAIFVVATGSDGREKIKKDYLLKARDGLRTQCANNLADISKAAALKFREGMISLYMRLEEKINDLRKPLEITRQSLGKKQEDVNLRQQKLADFRQTFIGLQSRSREFCEKL